MYTMSYPYVSAGDALNLYFPSANMPSPNRMNWDDKETDQWLFEARGATSDEARAAAYAKIEKKVHRRRRLGSDRARADVRRRRPEDEAGRGPWHLRCRPVQGPEPRAEVIAST